MGEIIDTVVGFLKSLVKPENLTLTSVLGLGVPILLYHLNRRNIPKLVFDGVWKQNAHVGIDYFLKVKRYKGKGEAEGVEGFVGIKDKRELKPTLWIDRNIETDIPTYTYLSLFKTLEHNGQKIITFPNADKIPPPPDFNFLLENYPYTKFKVDKLMVEIIAKRARIDQKQFTKKIDDIVKEAKQIPP